MQPQLTRIDFELTPNNNEYLANVCGPFDEHLRLLERRLGVEIANRGHFFRLIGEPAVVSQTQKLLRDLYTQANDVVFSAHQINLILQDSGAAQIAEREAEKAHAITIKVKRGVVKGRGANQITYLHKIATHDLNFGVGPAGTGKTYLAVASAVEALESNRVQRLLLVRPAVEAGEKLGFLPGDLIQKVDPYLRPLYDALYEMLGVEKVMRLIERNVIEVAPLAFMRGRTLNDAFIILDEAQNTTIEQMKMFLTRLGFGSTAVITGDMTQIDLPRKEASGLRHALNVLKDVEGISLTYFQAADVVRHPLVQRVVRAYERAEAGEST
jgi:phosphate starvation-inducible protein PhoH and related proteins